MLTESAVCTQESTVRESLSSFIQEPGSCKAEQASAPQTEDKEIHSQWEQGHVIWGASRDTVWICRDGVRHSREGREM